MARSSSALLNSPGNSITCFEQARAGRLLTDGIRVAIIGKPNARKIQPAERADPA